MAAPTDDAVQYTERAPNLLANNYGPAPLLFDRAEGAWLITADGRRYLDFGSGISVTSFGQGHPAVRAAVARQMDKLWHTSNLFYTEPALRLAEQLIEHSFAQRVFFANSGAEANEAAIKLVRKAASSTRPSSQRVILTFHGGFHGRTLATVTATAQPKYHQGFEPLPEGFRYCAFNDIEALREAFDETVCAVMFEPVQGEGGIHVAHAAFVAEIRRLANERGALVIADEVQSGVARTGRLWAHQWYEGFVPDLLTSAKALGGGLPIGALLLGERVQDVLQPGSHGSTFGGNPLCCAAATAIMELATDTQLQRRVHRQGQTLRAGFQRIDPDQRVFCDVRGRGLMLGAELRDELKPFVGALVSACRDQGLLVLQAGNGVLRLLPPLTLTDAEIDQMLQRLARALDTDWASTG